MIRRLVTRGEDGRCLQYSRTTDGETQLGGEKLMFESIIKEILRMQGVWRRIKMIEVRTRTNGGFL